MVPQFPEELGQDKNALWSAVLPHVEIFPAVLRRRVPGAEKSTMADRIIKKRRCRRVRVGTVILFSLFSLSGLSSLFGST